MSLNLPLPPEDLDTAVHFTNSAGEEVASVEVGHLNDLLAFAAQGLDLRREANRLTWMQNFARKLTEATGVKFSATWAAFVAKEVRERTELLKKTFNDLQTLPSSTDSTPPDSTPESSSFSTAVSPGLPPYENSASDPLILESQLPKPMTSSSPQPAT